MCQLGSMALSCKYTYIYIYIYMFIYLCIHTYRDKCVDRGVWYYLVASIHIYIYMYIHICLCIYMYTYMDVQWGGAVHVLCDRHGTSGMRSGHTAHCHALQRTATHCNRWDGASQWHENPCDTLMIWTRQRTKPLLNLDLASFDHQLCANWVGRKTF